MRATGRTRLLRLLILSLTLTALFGATAPAPAAAATSLKVCGEVTTYVKATALLDGALVVGVTPLVIKAGTVLDSDIKQGANLCLDFTLDLSGKVTDAVVRANVTAELRICGDVTAYVKATATSAGSLKIAGRTLTLAAGSSLPAAVKVGADLCLELTLDGFGQVKNGTATANAAVHVKICGDVTAYAAASLTSTGTLKIAGRSFVLALGSSLPAAVRVGADLCVDLTLNGFGQVSNGTATANVDAHVRLCGVVTAYSAATLTSTGHLAVAGKSFVLGLGSKLPAAVKAGADLCLDLTVNVFGQVSGGTAVVNVHATLEVCGQVTAYVKATSTTNGRLAIGNLDRTIAAGTSLDAAVKAGAYLRLRLTVDAFGRISDAVVLKVGATLAQACTNAAPTPTPVPTPDDNATPAPTPTPSPTPQGAGPTPSASPTNGATPSPTPGGSPTPSATPTPGGSAAPTPSGGEAGATASADSCVPGSDHSSDGSVGGTGTEAGGDGTVALPDTASLGRTGTLLAATSVPLMLGLGVLLGSLMQRRRMATVPVNAADDEGEGDGGR